MLFFFNFQSLLEAVKPGYTRFYSSNSNVLIHWTALCDLTKKSACCVHLSSRVFTFLSSNQPGYTRFFSSNDLNNSLNCTLRFDEKICLLRKEVCNRGVACSLLRWQLTSQALYYKIPYAASIFRHEFSHFFRQIAKCLWSLLLCQVQANPAGALSIVVSTYSKQAKNSWSIS